MDNVQMINVVAGPPFVSLTSFVFPGFQNPLFFFTFLMSQPLPFSQQQVTHPLSICNIYIKRNNINSTFSVFESCLRIKIPAVFS